MEQIDLILICIWIKLAKYVPNQYIVLYVHEFKD